VGTKVRYPASSIKRNQKYLQQSDSQGLPKDYQAGNGFYQNFKSKYLCSIGQKAEKTSQTSGFQLQIKEGIFQALLHFWYKKGTSQLSKVSPKTALQELSPDGLHGREPDLHIFFCNKWNSMTLG
jgi:hypothetical protein